MVDDGEHHRHGRPGGVGARRARRVGQQHVAQRDGVSDVTEDPVDGGNLVIGLGDLAGTAANQRQPGGAAGHDASREDEGDPHHRSVSDPPLWTVRHLGAAGLPKRSTVE